MVPRSGLITLAGVLAACSSVQEVPVVRVERVEVPVIEYRAAEPPQAILEPIEPSSGVVFIAPADPDALICLSDEAAAALRYDVERLRGRIEALRVWTEAQPGR